MALGHAAAGDSARVSFSPQSAAAAMGESVAVDVMVSNVGPDPGLASYDLVLTFDPTVVRLDSLSDSGFITNGENVVICVTGEIDNAGGSVNATCDAIALFGAPGVATTAAVPLLHASFTALADGTSALRLSGTLSGPEGTPIAATFDAGAIDVGAASEVAGVTPAATAGTSGLPSTGLGGGGRSPVWAAAMLAGAIAGIAGFATLLFVRSSRTRRA